MLLPMRRVGRPCRRAALPVRERTIAARLASVIVAVGAVAALVAASGCAAKPRQEATEATPEPASITVSAAMTLKDPFERIAREFERDSGVKVVLNFGASGVLKKQIEGGSRVDVFASASHEQIDELIAGGFVSADASATFASNRVVVLMRPGEGPAVTSARDLVGLDRIATGDPGSTPIGQAAYAWLERQGVLPALEGRLVHGENVVQVMEYLTRGEVDAAIVFASEATGRSDVKVVHTVPDEQVPPIRYVIAPLIESENPTQAAAFVRFVLSERGRQALADAGFRLPGPVE